MILNLLTFIPNLFGQAVCYILSTLGIDAAIEQYLTQYPYQQYEKEKMEIKTCYPFNNDQTAIKGPVQ